MQKKIIFLYAGKCVEEFDKYKAVAEWMPYVKGVSAKAIDFDAAGNCVETDYTRVNEEKKIKKTKELLERTASAIA